MHDNAWSQTDVDRNEDAPTVAKCPECDGMYLPELGECPDCTEEAPPEEPW